MDETSKGIEGSVPMHLPSRRDRLGLGLAALGRPAYITAGRQRDVGVGRSIDEMRAMTAQVLDAAYASGIRYIDAARSYGRAEEFLAAWLASRPEVTDVSIASKWGYRYVGDWRLDADVHEVKDHSIEAFRTQLQESRTLLGSRLALYQVHSVTEDSPVLTDERLHEALAELRDSGVAVGFSTSGPRQAATIRGAIALDVGGMPLFSSVQSTWNVLETSAGDALVEAHQAGVSVVIKECFANGRLAPGSSDPSMGVRLAAQIASDLDVGLDQLAVAAAVRQPWASRVLTGAVTAAQIESHCRGAGLEIHPDVYARLTEINEEPAHYWATRSERAWT